MRATAGIRRAWILGVLVAAAAALATVPGAAQEPEVWDWRATKLSRAQLTQILARYEAAATSSAYSEGMKARVQSDVDSIQARLANGDMHVGDRLRLVVLGQAGLSGDSFAVTAGPALVLPVVGSVDLKGVLRSELQARLTARIDSVYRGASVRVEPLIRVAVLGGIGKAGFYALPADALIPDVLTVAGGVAPNARLDRIYIDRGRSRLWGPDSLEVAMQEGRTIGALHLTEGDRIVVPLEMQQSPLQTVQVLSYLLSLSLSLFTVSRVL